jgi:hypothetical protein
MHWLAIDEQDGHAIVWTNLRCRKTAHRSSVFSASSMDQLLSPGKSEEQAMTFLRASCPRDDASTSIASGHILTLPPV